MQLLCRTALRSRLQRARLKEPEETSFRWRLCSVVVRVRIRLRLPQKPVFVSIDHDPEQLVAGLCFEHLLKCRAIGMLRPNHEHERVTEWLNQLEVGYDIDRGGIDD